MDSGAAPDGEKGVPDDRTLALDYGDRRIGVAVSDPSGLLASAVLTLERVSWKADLARISDLARRHQARRIVVGLPLEMDGTRGERVRIAEVFMTRVRKATGLPVVPWDERLTTVQAERTLLEGDVSRARRREVIDQVAAVILLQAYLDSRRRGGSGS
jgi:putative Holliday junction resolvase